RGVPRARRAASAGQSHVAPRCRRGLEAGRCPGSLIYSSRVAAPFLQTVRTGFSRSFWVANTLELFERFSYYASKAVLAVYLAEHLGLGPVTATLYGGSIFNTL